VTPAEFESALNSLRLSQRGAAALIGVNERTVRAWLAGEYAVASYAQNILRLEQENRQLRAALQLKNAS
jgi:DNA-binding transcriptional regulator YiaG